MTDLTITRDTVTRLSEHIYLHGARNVETGGFLLSEARQPDNLCGLALAGRVGIRRAPDLFEVSGSAIERLFSWAAENDLRIRAQAHSHREGAFLSPTDLRYGFSVAGFITSVVPFYRAPSHEPRDWGWWRYQSDTWVVQKSPRVIGGSTSVVIFDAQGITHGG